MALSIYKGSKAKVRSSRRFPGKPFENIKMSSENLILKLHKINLPKKVRVPMKTTTNDIFCHFWPLTLRMQRSPFAECFRRNHIKRCPLIHDGNISPGLVM